MVRKKSECTVEMREHMRQGPGTVKITHFVTEEELYHHGRLFANVTLVPGAGIGYHTHEHESEIFYILKGTALFNDNGAEITVHAGDVTLTGGGAGHAITNLSDEDVELVALIIQE